MQFDRSTTRRTGIRAVGVVAVGIAALFLSTPAVAERYNTLTPENEANSPWCSALSESHSARMAAT